MEFFKQNTKSDFMAQRKWSALISIVLFSVSIISFSDAWFKLGLILPGGTQSSIKFSTEANLNQIRDNLQKAGFPEATVISYGTSKDVLVSLVPKRRIKQYLLRQAA